MMLDHTGKLLPLPHEQIVEQIKTFAESVGALVLNTNIDDDTTTVCIVIKHTESQ